MEGRGPGNVLTAEQISVVMAQADGQLSLSLGGGELRAGVRQVLEQVAKVKLRTDMDVWAEAGSSSNNPRRARGCAVSTVRKGATDGVDQAKLGPT